MKAKKRVKFTLQEIADDFLVNSRKPLCLQEVFTNMKNKGTIVAKDEFVANLQGTWADVPWKMIKAGTSMLYTALSPKSHEQRRQELAATEFLHLERLEERAQALLNQIKDIGHVYCKKSDIPDCDDEVIDLLMNYLKFSTQQIDFMSTTDDVYIKISSKMTENDVAIIKTEMCIEELESNIADLDHKIRAKKVELKNSIAKGDSRTRAKFILKEVKVLSSTLEKKCSTAETLRQVFHSLQDAEDSKKIVASLQAAKASLQSQHQELPGNADQIQDLVNDIKDLIQDTEEVSKALAASEQTDDDDLEADLKRLLEEENEHELQQALDKLTVCDSNPNDDDEAKSPLKKVALTETL